MTESIQFETDKNVKDNCEASLNKNGRSKNGSDSRILLTGVFGPFAQDDEYGSRKVNPMELYHNQVTRVQGPFSLRMFHRTLGLMMIEANIDAPCTLLDFPTLDRFVTEITTRTYDIIGISGISPNVGKVKKMCEEIRGHQPNATIVVGGHVTNVEGLDRIIDADYMCRGDGIRWFRNFLGQDVDAPIMHPTSLSGFGTRIMGIPVSEKNMAAVLIPSVGCPVGCNFCCTSALFGGKGKSVSFYDTGDELFSVLLHLEKKLKAHSFFVMDENFLLYKKRALRLLELMEQHNKSWSFYIFSSARALQSYTMEQLIKLGISWVWLGLEGKDSKYSKLDGVDTFALVREFQDNGIRVLGSTIIGMEEHTPENINDAIDYSVRHDTDFHQFMLYTPMPGTPLYEEQKKNQTLLSEEECPAADVHGQERFNYKHRHIRDGQEKHYLLRAFEQDFEINGPSLARIARTTLAGWKKYKNHPDRRIVRRFKSDRGGLGSAYAGCVWAMTRWYRDDMRMRKKTASILNDLYMEFGFPTRILAPVIGTFLRFTLRKEAKRLEQGWTYEPRMIYEKNARALELEKKKFPIPGFRIQKIKLPAYDLSTVMKNCTDQMEEVRLRIQEIRDKVGEQIAHVSEQIHVKSEPAREQMLHLRTNFSEKRDQAGEQVTQVYENMMKRYESAKEEITRIQTQMNERNELAREELIRLRKQMKKKYKNARKQIDQMFEQIIEKYSQAREQIDFACDQAGEQIRYMITQLQEAECL